MWRGSTALFPLVGVFSCLSVTPALANGHVFIAPGEKTVQLGFEGGPLAGERMGRDEDVECQDEVLHIRLLKDQVRVKVNYTYKNHAATKTLDYAFPYPVMTYKDAKGKPVSLGFPTNYRIRVDGMPAASQEKNGPVFPVRHENDTGAHATDERVRETGLMTRLKGHALGKIGAQVRWHYRVTQIEFPSDRPIKVEVSYTTAYLIKRDRFGEQRQFTYLIWTGRGWRGNTIDTFLLEVDWEAVAPLPTRQQLAEWMGLAVEDTPQDAWWMEGAVVDKTRRRLRFRKRKFDPRNREIRLGTFPTLAAQNAFYTAIRNHLEGIKDPN